MVWSLMLLTLLNGEVHVQELDHGLTRSECVEVLAEMNQFANNNEQVVCYAEFDH